MDQQIVKNELKSQYHASLDMLGEAIEKCPEDLLYDKEFKNAFWQVAYHTLFFAHAYLSLSKDLFVPWSKHQANNQNPDGIGGDPDPDSKLPLLPDPYTKDQLLEYWGFCKGIVNKHVDMMDLESTNSGFDRYKISKFEHQLVNLRHIQHGAAQLADRLRDRMNIGVRWVGRGKK